MKSFSPHSIDPRIALDTSGYIIKSSHACPDAVTTHGNGVGIEFGEFEIVIINE